jgi:alginate O-acetyltransferase complex protein AlgI
MLFQSYEFFAFFAFVCALYYAVPQSAWRPRSLVLLAASYLFYALWNRWYVVMLVALTASDYLVAIGLEAATGRRRRALLTLGIAANLAFLGALKYANFATGSLAGLFGARADPWIVHWIVPVGISFHTFQSISYVVDVYRGKFRAVRDPLDYALYIGFFPQLLAGPIVRAGRFFGELYAWRAPAVPDVARGLREILLGLVKKTAIADQFAPISDAYFGAIAAHPGAPAAWSAVFAFAMQIYFDFSGYSDIAIGCARLLGFPFPDNFRRPYLAWSISEFWRRWHITLSTWLRDYLYIPLGGNRHGALATLRNLMVTMLLGGLWHGANWTFVAWGGYHGLLLAAERLPGYQRLVRPSGAGLVARTALTFGLVLFGWVLFRAQNFGDALAVARQLVSGGSGAATLVWWPLGLVAASLAIGIAQERGARFDWRTLPIPVQAGALAGLLIVLALLSFPGPAATFVYFKF